ncbi:MAG: MgtC/SapB family protein [Erysipelotrichaceae bacterium]|nr:MgtC/SapB family protein [Erysipelotrichaceae bacterium]
MDNILAFISYIQDFNGFSVMLRIILAVIAGGIIGNERGVHGSAAGLRTHIFVCVGSALTSICSLYVSKVLGFSGDVFRIPASVVSGIGFLGAGTILVKSDRSIAGLTTAAGMWVTAITGIAFGYGFYTGDIVTTLICIVNASLLTRIEHNRIRYMRFYVEVNNVDVVQSIVDKLYQLLNNDVLIETIPAKSGIVGNVGLEVMISTRTDFDRIKKELSSFEGINYIVQ